jgi:hypothetical protein
VKLIRASEELEFQGPGNITGAARRPTDEHTDSEMRSRQLRRSVLRRLLILARTNVGFSNGHKFRISYRPTQTLYSRFPFAFTFPLVLIEPFTGFDMRPVWSFGVQRVRHGTYTVMTIVLRPCRPATTLVAHSPCSEPSPLG